MILPKCYSCGNSILQVIQRTEDNVTFIDFIHEYGDCCTDIIETDYMLDPINKNYFNYIWNLVAQLNALKVAQ
jgi:hypothetical protein